MCDKKWPRELITKASKDDKQTKANNDLHFIGFIVYCKPSTVYAQDLRSQVGIFPLHSPVTVVFI